MASGACVVFCNTKSVGISLFSLDRQREQSNRHMKCDPASGIISTSKHVGCMRVHMRGRWIKRALSQGNQRRPNSKRCATAVAALLSRRFDVSPAKGPRISEAFTFRDVRKPILDQFCRSPYSRVSLDTRDTPEKSKKKATHASTGKTFASTQLIIRCGRIRQGHRRLVDVAARPHNPAVVVFVSLPLSLIAPPPRHPL